MSYLEAPSDYLWTHYFASWIIKQKVCLQFFFLVSVLLVYQVLTPSEWIYSDWFSWQITRIFLKIEARILTLAYSSVKSVKKRLVNNQRGASKHRRAPENNRCALCTCCTWPWAPTARWGSPPPWPLASSWRAWPTTPVCPISDLLLAPLYFPEQVPVVLRVGPGHVRVRVGPDHYRQGEVRVQAEVQAVLDIYGRIDNFEFGDTAHWCSWRSTWAPLW